MSIVEEYGEINHSLIRANTILSVALFSLGILISLHAANIAFADVDFHASGPLAFHLLLMAGLFTTSKRKLLNPYRPMSTLMIWLHVFMGLGLLAISTINVILSGGALFQMKADDLWVVFLALPAYFNWLNYSQNEIHDNLRKEADLEAADEDKFSDAEVASEVTKANPLQILWSGFINIKHQVLVSFLTILFLIIGLLYYYFLSAAFFDDYIWSFDITLRIIRESGKGLIPVVIAIIVVIPLIFGSISLWQALVRWRLKKDQDDIDRDLRDDEIDLINHCTTRLENYLEEKKYSPLVKSVYWFVIIGFVGVMVGYIFVAIAGNGIGSSWFKGDRVAGLEWYIYLDSIGVAEILGLFVIGIGYFALFTHLFRNWRDLSEHNLLKSKTEHSGPYDILGTLSENIALDVRKYIITSKHTFDPASYLQFRSKSYGKWMNIFTLILFSISLYFWILDRRDYDLFAPDFIEYTDYWSGKVHQARYSDVVAVQITCKIGKKDKLNRNYELLLHNGREISVTETDGSLTKNLDNWERVDKILSDQETPRIYGRFNQDPDSTKIFFNSEQCRAGLTKLHGHSTADRIMELMRK